MESKNNFLQDLLDDYSLQEAILDGLRALEDCAPFALEEIPELSSPLAFNAWLMDLEVEEEEQQRAPTPPLEEEEQQRPPIPPLEEEEEEEEEEEYELRRPHTSQPPPDLVMQTPPASPTSYMLYEPHEGRYYEVSDDFVEFRDQPPSSQEEDCDADDEMEVSQELCRPLKRRRHRRRHEDRSPSPPRRRRRLLM